MRSTLLPIALLLLAGASVHAQSFTITITTSPRTAVLKDGKATFEVRATPVAGFDASVYLSVTVPDLPAAQVKLTTSTINRPYTTLSTVTITVPGGAATGDYPVIVKGENGPVQVFDTVTLEVTAPPGWRVYTTKNSGMFANAVAGVALTRNGVAWLTTVHKTWQERNPLTRFDGSTWQIVATPPGYPDDTLGSPLADSLSGVWFTTDRGLAYVSAEGEWSTYNSTNSPTMPTGPVAVKAVAPDNRLWVRINDTLAYLEGATWIRVPNAPSCPACRFGIDPRGDVWFVQPDKLIRFDGTFTTTYDRSELVSWPSDNLREMTIDRSGRVWVLSAHAITLISSTGPSVAALDRVEPSALEIDPKGTAWMAVSNPPNEPLGVACGNPGLSVIYNTANSGLPSNIVPSIVAAADGVFWFGTDKGLAIYDPRIRADVEHDDRDLSRSVMRLRPNPLHGSGTLTLDIPEPGRVSVDVVSTLGERIAAVIDETIDAGTRTIPFDASFLPTGAYFIRLESAGRVETLPLVVTR